MPAELKSSIAVSESLKIERKVLSRKVSYYKIPVLVSSDELGGEAAKTCSYGVEFHLLDALIGTTEKIVRSKKAHFDILQVDLLRNHTSFAKILTRIL